MPNLKTNQRGQGLVEYIMIVVLMGILAIAAVKKLGKSTTDGFTNASRELTKELSGK